MGRKGERRKNRGRGRWKRSIQNPACIIIRPCDVKFTITCGGKEKKTHPKVVRMYHLNAQLLLCSFPSLKLNSFLKEMTVFVPTAKLKKSVEDIKSLSVFLKQYATELKSKRCNFFTPQYLALRAKCPQSCR